MQFAHRYQGASAVDDSARATSLSFAPDLLREPAYFVGDVARHLVFREAISALHAVVISDLRWQPKDRTEYLRWAQQRDLDQLAEFMARGEAAAVRATELRKELESLRGESAQILEPYYRAQNRYFKYLWQVDRDAWWVLDPVLTVHPDEVFFECFSQDESSYGRLSCDFDSFSGVRESACGTTNIDYSAGLYDSFQKIRSYKTTQLRIEPGGFEVATTDEDSFVERKIDVPESWVRGFLQVSSAMTMPATSFELNPMDVHAFCVLLRRKREQHGPRSIRFVLEPDRPVRAVFEPWNAEVTCRHSRYKGADPMEIRIWGRRRLLVLERLIPIARSFRVHLLGSGMPSFFVADLGGIWFTLGLSGWTANDWSRLGNFDLMAPRAEVDDFTKVRVFNALKETWCESADSLTARLGLDSALVRGALAAYTQAGRVIYDLDKGLYRVRELARDPLPTDALRFDNEREEKAARFVDANLVKELEATSNGEALRLRAKVRDDARLYAAMLSVDGDERLIEAHCDCAWHARNKLFKGPCEHILAARMAHVRGRH